MLCESSASARRLAFVALVFLLAILVPSDPSRTQVFAAGAPPSTLTGTITEPQLLATSCSADQLKSLESRAMSARGSWIANLNPNAYGSFAAARAAYVDYVTRCAKQLNLNPKQVLKGVLSYDAPAGAQTPALNSQTLTPASLGDFFDGTPGTAAPPSTLGPYKMTPFPVDPRGDVTPVNGVNSPLGGAVQFGSTLTHYVVGAGWSTWSNSYSGGVYGTASTGLTMYLPPDTRAFYFYAQSNDLATFDFTATADDGTSSYPVSITSPSGAKYFGFYAPVSGAPLSSISVSCPACGGDGFAVGEFGINQNAGADLRLTKFSEPHDVVQAGQIFTYTIFVDNLGPDIASHVIVTDTLLSSGSVSIQSCAFSVSQGGGAITQFTCTTGDLVSTQFGTDVGTFATNSLDPLSPGSQGRLRASFRLTAKDAIDVTNTTRVSSDTFDPNLDNNFAADALTVTPASDLQVSKSAPRTAGAGEQITYTIQVKNIGPSEAPGVKVLDYIAEPLKLLSVTPDRGSCQAGTAGDPLRPLACSLGTLASNTGVTVTILAQVKPTTLGDTIIFNDVQVAGAPADTNKSNNVDSVSTTVNATCAALPSLPALLSPLDTAIIKPSQRVLLDWQDANCALNYRVVVRQGSSVGALVQLKDDLTVSQFMTKKLSANKKYYWRVRACNGIGCVYTTWHWFKVTN